MADLLTFATHVICQMGDTQRSVNSPRVFARNVGLPLFTRQKPGEDEGVFGVVMMSVRPLRSTGYKEEQSTHQHEMVSHPLRAPWPWLDL